MTGFQATGFEHTFNNLLTNAKGRIIVGAFH